ncbi:MULTISPECIES: RNA polymerase sigma factor SigJ [unclassified Streptomyces]|uniref:RNA polymerase sigma factor SigJ n=1 Tax=unclassified Streptomyces TaxID=2593676 RepID=UPI0027815C2F|nr:RNA polymerase sigma factor SigJ [Streptomyces sp. DSM 40167]MDQ0406926.1 RNA polymerase sigma-70 factor (ECF subfamily) [Streptomyces sp. DSM 40167]
MSEDLPADPAAFGGAERDEPRDLDPVMAERRRLLSLAFRMMGTLADAEDVVQETYVRWYRLEPEERDSIAVPAAWLMRVASRISLDLLGSARVRRETYVGQWLPEPVPADLFADTANAILNSGRLAADPLERVTLDDAVSMALLTVLEAMTPAERVTFVLHDVFGVPFDEIAGVVGRSAAATRQLATSARRHVRRGRRARVSPHQHDEVVRAFRDATVGGGIEDLLRVLAPGVELRVDGGGFVNAAPQVIRGPDHVARWFMGVMRKQPTLRLEQRDTADGLGYIIRNGGRRYGVLTFEVSDECVTNVWLMLNPMKLTNWPPE